MCKQNVTAFLDSEFNNFSSKHSVCNNETFANSTATNWESNTINSSVDSRAVAYLGNYWQDILSTNYWHIIYEIIIGKLQLIAANVT